MARRFILKMGDETLRKKSKPVTEFDKKLGGLLDDMLETLRFYEGLGLAAPQVGILKRAVVIEYDDVLYEIVNPVLLEAEGESVDNEGCLSVEGFRGIVKRPKKVKIKYQDRSGKEHILEGEDYFARCILHEMDHLEGILFVDKMIKKIEMRDE